MRVDCDTEFASGYRAAMRNTSERDWTVAELREAMTAALGEADNAYDRGATGLAAYLMGQAMYLGRRVRVVERAS